MSLFDWLWHRRYERLPTRIYLTDEAKWDDICRDVVHCRQDGALVILTAHFPATLRRAAQALERGPVGHDLLSERIDHERLHRLMSHRGPAPVQLVLADRFDDGERYLCEELSSTVSVLVAEKHPLPRHDERIEAFARGLSCRCRLADYVSLEDPLLKRFAGKRVAQMLRALGMPENDAVNSSLVTRRLRSAQRQVQRRALGDERSDSAEQWFRRNCPDLAESEN